MDPNDNKLHLTQKQQEQLNTINSEPDDTARVNQLKAKAREESAQIDNRPLDLKRQQWIEDWETPMWLFVIIDTVCLLLGPMVRHDFAMSYAGLKSWHLISIISAMFMHADSFHLISNMVMLIILGTILKSIPISSEMTVLAFLGGGVACNVLVIPFIMHTPMLVMGASGGIATLDGMAIILTAALVIRRQKYIRIDQDHVYGFYGAKLAVSATLVLVLLDTNLYRISPDAFFLHLFGLIIGLVIGFYVYRRFDY